MSVVNSEQRNVQSDIWIDLFFIIILIVINFVSQDLFICVLCYWMRSHLLIYIYCVCERCLLLIFFEYSSACFVVRWSCNHWETNKIQNIFFFRRINYYLSTQPIFVCLTFLRRITKYLNFANASLFHFILRCGDFFLLFDDQKMFTLNRKVANFFLFFDWCQCSVLQPVGNLWVFILSFVVLFHPGASFIIYIFSCNLIKSVEYLIIISHKELAFSKTKFLINFYQRSMK